LRGLQQRGRAAPQKAALHAALQGGAARRED
jgi:hypothetical protein